MVETNTIADNGLWKLAATFLLGVSVSIAAAYIVREDEIVTRNQLENYSPWQRDRQAIELRIKNNFDAVVDVNRNIREVRVLILENLNLSAIQKLERYHERIRTPNSE